MFHVGMIKDKLLARIGFIHIIKTSLNKMSLFNHGLGCSFVIKLQGFILKMSN
jgi:hypothetical protein